MTGSAAGPPLQLNFSQMLRGLARRQYFALHEGVFAGQELHAIRMMATALLWVLALAFRATTRLVILSHI